MFNIRTLIERYSEVNKDMYICFIDYEQAFDSVNHAKFIQCLQNIGISGKDIKLIVNLYWGQKAFVRTNFGLSQEINIIRGVRQGCVLSPSLFNLYTDNIFKAIEDMAGGMNINNLRYADDTVLIADKEEDLHNLLDEVDKQGREFGMRMNVKKTKAMIISRNVLRPGEMTLCVANNNIQ